MNLNENLKGIESLLKNGHFEQAWEKANEIDDASLFKKLGYLFKQYAQWANAINFFNKSLQHKNDNDAIKNEIEFLTGILKQEQLDIFASTNLNKDPWLE